MDPGIPNMGWAMAFSQSKFESIKWDTIQEAGFAVSANENLSTVRISDKITDVADDFGRFAKRRTQLKRLIGSQMFVVQD